MNLEFASPKWQNNYDIVYAAVNRNGLSLKFASDVLKNDRYII